MWYRDADGAMTAGVAVRFSGVGGRMEHSEQTNRWHFCFHLYTPGCSHPVLVPCVFCMETRVECISMLQVVTVRLFFFSTKRRTIVVEGERLRHPSVWAFAFLMRGEDLFFGVVGPEGNHIQDLGFHLGNGLCIEKALVDDRSPYIILYVSGAKRLGGQGIY